MEMSGDTALSLAKSYVRQTVEGLGAVKGKDGFSPIIEESPYNAENNYQLDIITERQRFTTPNLLGADGKNGSVVTIGADGNWYIDDIDTGVKAIGEDGENGITPTIDLVTKHWFIGDVDTGILAEGQKGEDGFNPTITIDTEQDNGYVLDIQTKDGVFKTPDLKGKDGTNGVDGFTPSINVQTDTETEYILIITNKTGSFITPNLKPTSENSGSIAVPSYNSLTDKPSINGVELRGNLTLSDLGIDEISNTEIENIIKSMGGL